MTQQLAAAILDFLGVLVLSRAKLLLTDSVCPLGSKKCTFKKTAVP
jgi:hypothetical protein